MAANVVGVAVAAGFVVGQDHVWADLLYEAVDVRTPAIEVCIDQRVGMAARLGVVEPRVAVVELVQRYSQLGSCRLQFLEADGGQGVALEVLSGSGCTVGDGGEVDLDATCCCLSDGAAGTEGFVVWVGHHGQHPVHANQGSAALGAIRHWSDTKSEPA